MNNQFLTPIRSSVNNSLKDAGNNIRIRTLNSAQKSKSAIRRNVKSAMNSENETEEKLNRTEVKIALLRKKLYPRVEERLNSP